MESQPNRCQTPVETVVQVDLPHPIQTHHGCAYRALQNQVESAFFATLMAISHGNKTQAARIAGLDTGTLNRYLARYTIAITPHVSIGGQKGVKPHA